MLRRGSESLPALTAETHDRSPSRPASAEASRARLRRPPRRSDPAEPTNSATACESSPGICASWPTKRGITCYRIYERDIPEIPLVVDRYEDALHIAEFERPHDRTPAEHADWLDLMVRTAAEALETPRDLVFVKHRRRQRGAAQYEPVDDRLATRVVQEGGLKFQVNLSDYVDTGLFLDHRITRSMVRDAATGTNFLNLFAYTGSFTVYAAAGGAAQTTTVDLLPGHLEWARRESAAQRLRRARTPDGSSRRPRVSRLAAAANRSSTWPSSTRRRFPTASAWTTTGTCSRTTPN